MRPAGELELDDTTLDYEQTLAELLGLLGRPVTVFAATQATPPATTVIIKGILERGDESPVLKTAHAAWGTELGEHVIFKVGASSYFLVVRSEFRETLVPEPSILMLQFRDHDLVVFRDTG